MAEDRELMTRNTLFLAVTRPALWAGIAIDAAVPILLASAIVLIGTNNPIYALALAIIALIVAGVGWLMGRVNTGALVTVIIGIPIIFSAPWIVDQISGGAGG